MNRLLSACSLVAVAALVGCGGDDSDNKVDVYPVSGTVKMFGNPLAGATVSFAPQEGQPTATATTDEDGKFQLRTYEFGDGAAEGKYKVVISKATTSPPSESSGDAGEHDDVVVESHAGGSGGISNEVPAQYTTSKDTPLTAEVKPGSEGDNVFPFEIE